MQAHLDRLGTKGLFRKAVPGLAESRESLVMEAKQSTATWYGFLRRTTTRLPHSDWLFLDAHLPELETRTVVEYVVSA